MKLIPILSAVLLATTSFPVQGQVWEFPEIVVKDILKGSWAPGAVVEVPPIFMTGPFELKRPAAADPFTKYLERRMKRRLPYAWTWPPIHLELSRTPDEFCAADYLTPEHREAIQKFDDLRFQFVVEDEPEEENFG